MPQISSNLRRIATICAVSVSICLQGVAGGLGGEIAGTWTDACPCKISCPCWATGLANVPRCVNIQTFQISAGKFAGAELAGRGFVLLNLPRSRGAAPSPQEIYVDPHMSVPDANAIHQLAELQLGPLRMIRYPVRMHWDKSRLVLKIPGVLSYHIEALEHEPPAQGLKDNVYPFLQSLKQWRAKRVSYFGNATAAIAYSGTNALTANFRFPAPQENAGSVNKNSTRVKSLAEAAATTRFPRERTSTSGSQTPCGHGRLQHED